MSEDDRRRWDRRYEEAAAPAVPGPPPRLAAFEDLFPAAGRAMDLACGRGAGAVWLASRGLEVWGLDVSPVAVRLAAQLADRWGVGDRCRFEVADLDCGLPDGPPVDVVLCSLFRDARLDRALVDRLAPGGLLAVVVLSEVGATAPSPYRTAPGELRAAFGGLGIVAEGEEEGEAWLLARA